MLARPLSSERQVDLPTLVGIGIADPDQAEVASVFGQLEGDGFAYLVACGESNGRAAALRNAIARVSSLRVVIAGDRQELRSNSVYLVLPGRALSIEGTTLHSKLLSSDRRALPIDRLFGELARALGARAAVLLLTGRGSDGEHGCRQVQREGGMCFALRPSRASEQQWLSESCATSLPMRTAGRIVAELRCLRDEQVRETANDGALVRQLCTRLCSVFSLDFSGHKASAITAQIAVRMAARHIEQLDGYLQLLDDSVQELTALRDGLLVGSTRFFRDEATFEVLKQRHFPLIAGADTGSSDPLRMWVAGCSTGEEAYSLAIVASEYFAERGERRAVRIYASDVREEALERGRRATYPRRIAAELSPERLARFFVPCEEGYRVVRSLREMVLWARHDVLRDPPFRSIHLLSCRNLLAYLHRTAQARALAKFQFSLRAEAALLLGSAESTVAADRLFTPLDYVHRVYQKRSGAPRARGLRTAANAKASMQLASGGAA